MRLHRDKVCFVDELNGLIVLIRIVVFALTQINLLFLNIFVYFVVGQAGPVGKRKLFSIRYALKSCLMNRSD